MSDILIFCPVTAEPVQTGLDTETVVFESLPPIAIPLLCTQCGQTHYWRPAQAWVNEPSSPDAIAINGKYLAPVHRNGKNAAH
jgi:hypothetical protein